MSLVRLLITAQITLTHTFFVDELATDATGPVTATLKRLDGTTVNSATAGHPGPAGQYTYTVPSQTQLDSLTLDWSGTLAGAAISVRDYVEIVGGHLFSIGDARHELGLDVNVYPTDTIADKRIEIEQEFEAICRQAFMPRFARESISGRGIDQLGTRHNMLRAVRAVSISGTVMSAPDVALLVPTEHGVIKRSSTWPAGNRNVTVEYEHGLDMAPEEIRTAGILRLRSRLGMTKTSIPDRALSYTVPDGGVYRLSLPSKQRTGLPEVDGVLERYTLARRVAVG